MPQLWSPQVEHSTREFLESYRLGVDFGDLAHGVAVLRQNQVQVGATLQDGSSPLLEDRRMLRRGRRTRESRRQRLARLRQWCLRNNLPDPDPYFNPTISATLWPPDRNGEKPSSALSRLSASQKQMAHRALQNDATWHQFLNLLEQVKTECSLVNPFIARRLAREGRATPLIFVRAIWHLFEHRGFDWHRRRRGEHDDEEFLNDKASLRQHLKSLILNSAAEEQLKEDIKERDKEKTKENPRSKAWLSDPGISEEITKARLRGCGYPTERRLNPPRDFVEQELKECLHSLPDTFGPKNSPVNFGQKEGKGPPDVGTKRAMVFEALKKLLSWNRREPRFDNRQLRGCTWCALRGIQRNTPRKKNVLELQIRAAIRDIQVASSPEAMAAEDRPKKTGRVSRQQRVAITGAKEGLNKDQYEQVLSLVRDQNVDRGALKEKLRDFFAKFTRLPKRVFVQEGSTRKAWKLTDPYKWHAEELLNLAAGWADPKKVKGRSRLCKECLRKKAETPPSQIEKPAGEADVILSQRALRARCERLVAWIAKNLPPNRFPIRFIRIEAVLPRPEQKARLKVKAGQGEPDQTPKARLKIRLMEQVGARCGECQKPCSERERRRPKAKRDAAYCHCDRPDRRGQCAYCAKEFPELDLQIEHIYPKSPRDTGGGIGPDVEINKTVACDRCNQGEKKNRLPFDYFQNVLGQKAWENWKKRVRSFEWSPPKQAIALLEKYELTPELAQAALARTGMVHRYLRQRLAAIYFSEQTDVLKKKDASQDEKQTAKEFLDWHISTPAGWMTSKCRLDWEHQVRNGAVLPLVPRKSPLRSREEREKALGRRLEAAPPKKHEDIRQGFARRAPIEDALQEFAKDRKTDPLSSVAVCDRTDLNHHWIDAAVLASLPPQPNQPRSMGGLWTRQVVDERHTEVRADSLFAPQAAKYLGKWGNGAVVFDLQRREPRYTAQQQETSLYGKYEPHNELKLSHKSH